MQKTSANNKGGFVEKSIADLQKALADTAEGMDYRCTHIQITRAIDDSWRRVNDSFREVQDRLR